MTAEELTPEERACPFCGSTKIKSGYVRDGRVVNCLECHASGAPAFHGPKDMPTAETRAWQNWNRRDNQASGSPLVTVPNTVRQSIADAIDDLVEIVQQQSEGET